MDIKELLIWSWRHKWWFVISIVFCLCIGALYFFTTTPTYSVRASIMLRTPDVRTQQGELMSLMGADANKSASDEIEMLTSRDLMEQIVDSLQLTIKVEKRHHLRWVPVFPCPDFAVAYNQPVEKKKVVHVKSDSSRYRITVYPRIAAIDANMRAIDVKRLARESQVIVLSNTSSNPKQTVAIFKMLLGLYNQADTKDRNKIASQSQTFLDDRLIMVQNNLNEIEMALEKYKTDYQITDLGETASKYRELIEGYQISESRIDLQLRELNKLEEQLKDSIVLKNMIGIFATLDTSSNLGMMCNEYNKQVISRMELVQSAKSTNPAIQTIDYVLARQRENIKRGANELRSTLLLRQNFITEQIDKYTFILAQLPEQERNYLIMQRQKQSIEEQLLYLVQKREENMLTLNSSSLPAKMVESPRISASVITPNIVKVGLGACVIGFILPLILFIIGRVKREYFDDIKK